VPRGSVAHVTLEPVVTLCTSRRDSHLQKHPHNIPAVPLSLTSNIKKNTIIKSATMPRRKALLIGINYFGTKHQLNGCINDAMNIRDYLVRDRGFSPQHHDMVMMTDAPESKGTPFEPTGANMMAASLPTP
jgi:hypothetical protein